MYFPPSPRAGSPVSLATAKLHLRVGGCYDAASAVAYTAEDEMIGLYLAAASILVEDVLGRSLLTQTWTATFAGPDGESKFQIDRGPFQAVIQIEALQAGAYVAVSSGLYVVRRVSNDDTNIRLVSGASWPAADADDAAWRVTFTAGYGVSEDVPAPIAAAILLVTGGLAENREDMREDLTVIRLLRPYMAPAY